MPNMEKHKNNIHATCCMQHPRMLTSNSNATCLAHSTKLFEHILKNGNCVTNMTWVSENRIYMDIHPTYVNLNRRNDDEPVDVLLWFPHFLVQVPNLRSSCIYIYISKRNISYLYIISRIIYIIFI